MSIAIGVTKHNLRPASTVPMPDAYRGTLFNPNNFNNTLTLFNKELMEKCWSQNPNDRPTFLEISQSPRQMSLKHPLVNFQTHDATTDAPIGAAYFVQTSIKGANLLWDKLPNEMEAAMSISQ